MLLNLQTSFLVQTVNNIRQSESDLDRRWRSQMKVKGNKKWTCGHILQTITLTDIIPCTKAQYNKRHLIISAFLTLMKDQGHTTILNVTDEEMSAFSEYFLFFLIYHFYLFIHSSFWPVYLFSWNWTRVSIEPWTCWNKAFWIWFSWVCYFYIGSHEEQGGGSIHGNIWTMQCFVSGYWHTIMANHLVHWG